MELLEAKLILTVLVLLILAAIAGFYKHHFSYWKKRGIKHLKPIFPFGNASNFFLGKASFGEIFQGWYLDMQRKGWAFGGAYFCAKPVFIPLDQELVKKIIISDFMVFPNHGMYVNEKNDPFSGHIFNLMDYKWRNLRVRFPAAFTASKMRRNVLIMERISREFVSLIEQLSLKNKPVDVKSVLSRFTIDIISACAFGMESNTLKGEDVELTKQARPFFDNQWSRISNTLVMLIPVPILGLFNFKLFPVGTTEYFMKLFRGIKEHREKESIKRNDLADLLIDLCDETKDHPDFSGKGKMVPLTFNEFASQMYVFFEAGFETSSSTQTFALYELAVNPKVQERLRKEIDTVLEKFEGHVGYDSINEMKYLDMVVDETLRKYPIFPILPRKSIRDYQIPDTDIVIENDTLVMVTNFGIHYDPEYYPDPLKFDPDRFLPENKASRPHCAYLPFGEGPRICVGKRFGIWQTKMGLVSIIKNFELTLSKKMKLPFSFDKSGLILAANGGVWLDFKKINQ
ncbi:probable cytochrome P450 6a14 [Euwallacea fornicatus]|uniref:probable cytochrome P450 6a14 n=1 Tax=Euwallacea fornicatus TaxID=995702 RepID=UPI00338E58CB